MSRLATAKAVWQRPNAAVGGAGRSYAVWQEVFDSGTHIDKDTVVQVRSSHDMRRSS